MKLMKWNKEKKFGAGIILTIALELLLIGFCQQIDAKFKNETGWLITICLSIIIIFSFLVFSKEADKGNQRFLFLTEAANLLKGQFGSGWAFVNLIYFITNISLLQNQLFALSQSIAPPNYIWMALLFACFLSIPFLLNAILRLNETTKTIENIDRKVLVTNLGFPSKDYLAGIPNNWLPIIQLIKEYTALQKLIIVLSDEAQKQIDTLSEGEYLHTKLFQRENIEIIVIPIHTDANRFETYFQETKHKLEYELKAYKNSDIIFNLTSGTTIQNIALAFLAMKGQRGAVYFHQTTKEIVSTNLDVFSVKELFDEFLETASGKPRE